jgi:hypothetical protein
LLVIQMVASNPTEVQQLVESARAVEGVNRWILD